MLDGILEEVRGGQSAALVLRGEAGIGKTALIDYCTSRATDCRVARVSGVESELELPFAALQQLSAPMLDGIGVLPDPQERALGVAFGLTSGTTPDLFVVGLATLSLLADIAAKRPLVCVVDDAQWLDKASSQVLGFVGRRLLAESVVLLFGVRETGDDRLFPALPSLTVEGLGEDDAHALLRATIAGRLDEHVRDRIVAETCGNPLGLMELPKVMSRSELAGGFVTGNTVPFSDLAEHYIGRIRGLPEATRRLMLLAAADPTGDARDGVAGRPRARHRTRRGRASEVRTVAGHRLPGAVRPPACPSRRVRDRIWRRAPGCPRRARRSN